MRRTSLLLAALLAATLAAYWQVGACGFVGYDDPGYVRDQPMVNQGMRSAAFCWAFTAQHGVNWHPLTSLSHQLDCSLFGVQPGPMHWVNLGWHLLNTALVFLVWRRLSGAEGPSALVAALFALHPLHVESVAWISERKDVLSTALWLLTLLAYARWVAAPSRGRYALVALGLAGALMAKPMAVTLPITLLLLDYWPLRRWPGKKWRLLVVEKWPLFALCFAGGVVALVVQDTVGATAFGRSLTLGMRLGNAAVSGVRYLGGMFWPDALSPFYPHPGWWPWWAILGAVGLLAAVSALAWRERVRRPWLLFGWCWYFSTLLPVLGLVQVGSQAMADRYTYVPLLGVFTMLAWSGAELLARRPSWRWPLTGGAVAILAACLLRTRAQVPVWKTPIGLVEHMRATVGDHPVIFREMATAMIVAGRPEEEVRAQYRRGHEFAPDYPYFLHELAMSAARRGRFGEARALLERVRVLTPGEVSPYHNLASVCKMQGRLDEAAGLLRTALALGPTQSDPRRLLAEVFVQQGRLPEAREALREAIRCDRWDWLAYNELGALEYRLGRYSDARAHLERAAWINPGDDVVQRNLATVRERTK